MRKNFNREKSRKDKNCSSILTMLGSGQFQPDCLEAVIKNLHETYQCRMYSRKLLMMGREDARNM